MLSEDEEIRRAEFLVRLLMDCRSRGLRLDGRIKDKLVAWSHDFMDWLPDELPSPPPNDEVGYRRRATCSTAFRAAKDLEVRLPRDVVVGLVLWGWPAPKGGWSDTSKPPRKPRGKPH